MNEWLKQITAISLLSMIISLIIPDKKMGKGLKMILPLMVSIVVINPVLNISKLNVDNLFNKNATSVIYQHDFLNYTYQKRLLDLQNKATLLLENNGINNANIKIENSVTENEDFKIDKMIIDISNSVININNVNIDIIEYVKSIICQAFNLQSEEVIVYV